VRTLCCPHVVDVRLQVKRPRAGAAGDLRAAAREGVTHLNRLGFEAPIATTRRRGEGRRVVVKNAAERPGFMEARL